MDDEFHVDPHGPSGRIAHSFMYNYYMRGLRKIKGDVELMELAIVPIDAPELRSVFDALVSMGVFTIERELKVVKINPDALKGVVADEFGFVEMLEKLKEHGFFKESLHIAVDIKEIKKK